jgi:queuine tRNA-ribosyltransferase
VQALGGLHAMTGWAGPILTDSGGFQAWSLIRRNPRFGALTDDGIVFKPEGSDRKYQLTPEKCIQLQIAYGADVVMCLDDCTHVDDPDAEQRASVRRTVAWAARCKREFTRLLEQKRAADGPRPLLFAVIQGGGSPELRRECAGALLELGFDGFGYGGWPLDSAGQLLDEMLAFTRSLVPAEFPVHALGVGHPVSIVACAAMGYGLFDSALPTRDARRGRLYTNAGREEAPRRAHRRSRPAPRAGDERGFRFLYIADEKYVKDARPIEAECDCHTCRTVARGYLHHLNTANEAAFQRLATIHNLRFMARLMDGLRGVRRF